MDNIIADVVVVGGGVAGFSAAVAAARAGCSVVLVEKNASLGGNAIATNVGTICGAYYRQVEGASLRPIAHPWLQELMAAVGNIPINYYKGLTVVPYQWAKLLKYMQDVLAQEKVNVVHGFTVGRLIHEKNSITEIIIENEELQTRIKAKQYVDATGNGMLSQLAGLEMLQSDSYQSASMVFRVSKVDSENEYALNMALRKNMRYLILENSWPKSWAGISVVPGSLRNSCVDLKFSLSELVHDEIKIKELNALGQKYCHEIFRGLKKQLGTFEKAALQTIFPEAGIRVLQRSKGKHILTEEEVLGGKKYETYAAVGTWPIEEWDEGGNVQLTHLKGEDYYTVPLECIQSYKLANLLLAGKNISATHKAIASARVMGTCVQTGYSAGVLAAERI